jgi:malyl-CoA/(S)-citramalyl-CoA lyase
MRLRDGLHGGVVARAQPDRHRAAGVQPHVEGVLFAKRILEAMPDGSGVAMIDGKMQDDATWKQAKVMVDLARLVAQRDPELAAAYGF